MALHPRISSVRPLLPHEQQAFHLLREHAHRTNKKVVDVAGSILESHQLLSKTEMPVTVEEENLARTDDDG